MRTRKDSDDDRAKFICELKYEDAVRGIANYTTFMASNHFTNLELENQRETLQQAEARLRNRIQLPRAGDAMLNGV